jgi:DNA topoisomerase-2
MDKSYLQKDESVTELQHIREKGAYAGSKEIVYQTQILYESDMLKVVGFKHCPCYFHCVNEIVVNAFDALVKNYHAPKGYGGRTTKICVNYRNGTFQVYNNGKGIDVEEVLHTDGKTYWNPFRITTKTMSGSNMNTKDKVKVVGGDNGLGAKITTYHSTYYDLKTYDRFNSRFYSQTYECDLVDVNSPITFHEPIIVEGDPKESVYQDYNVGTCVTFRLANKFLGYEEFTPLDEEYMEKYLKALLIMLRFHVESLGLDIKVLYNGLSLEGDLSYTHKEKVIMTHLDPKGREISCPFNVYIGSSLNLSIINNLAAVPSDKSTHVSYFKKYVNDRLKADLSTFCINNKLTTYNITKIFKNINFILSGQIPNIAPNSQMKEVIQFNDTKMKSFNLSSQFLTSIKDIVIEKLKTKIVQKQPKLKTIKPKFKEGHGDDQTLIITEGKHASDSIDLMLDSMDRRKFAIFDIGGVPTNTYKNVEIVDGLYVLGKKMLHMDPKTKSYDNKLLQLITILGLEIGQTEFKGLKYKRVIIATDQDLDGVGHITAMILLFFSTLWRGLFDIQYIWRWQSPICKIEKSKCPSDVLGSKMYKNLNTLEFYSEIALDNYLKELAPGLHIDDIKEAIKGWCDIKYFKGLGSHDDISLKDLASRFEENLICYKWSKATQQVIDILYSKDTRVRKDFLKEEYTKEDVKIVKGQVTIANHLINETRFFHLLKITRALPCYIDGQTVSHRKVLYYCLNHWNGREIAIGKLGGDIKGKLQYHHGEVAMCNSIIGLTQSFKGANPIKFFNGKSNFGSIKNGKHTLVQPRYVRSTKSTLLELMFPKEDLPLLDYSYDDGKRVEPTFLIPILPMAVLMNWQAPATGWRSQIWCRSVTKVIEIIKNMIKSEFTYTCPDLWGCLYTPRAGLNPSWPRVKSREYEEAVYTTTPTPKGNTKVIITELPTGVYVNSFTEGMKTFNIDVKDLSTDKAMKLLMIVPATEVLKDRLIAFGLAIHMCSHLNYLNEFNVVQEFTHYEEVINAYFPIRQKYYELRLKRNMDLLELRLIRLKGIIKFIINWKALGITNDTTKNEWVSILEKGQFIKLDMKALTAFVKDVKAFALELGNPSYKYIMDMKIWSISPEKLKKFREERDRVLKEIETLKLETWQGLWLKDIEALEKALKGVY